MHLFFCAGSYPVDSLAKPYDQLFGPNGSQEDDGDRITPAAQRGDNFSDMNSQVGLKEV
jgi:hypothetical protein